MSLRLQLLLAFAYVLLLIIVALEVPLALNLARRIDAEVKNDAATQALVVAASASGRMGDRAQLATLVRRAGSDLGARVIVVNRRGRLLADSTVPDARPVSYASRPEIRSARGGGRAQGTRHSDTLGQDLLYTAVPVTNNGRIVGVVRVTQSLAAVHAKVRRGVLRWSRSVDSRWRSASPSRGSWRARSHDRCAASRTRRGGSRAAISRLGRKRQARRNSRRSPPPSTTWRSGSRPCSPRSASSSRMPRISCGRR